MPLDELRIDVPLCDTDGLFFGSSGSAAATPAAVAARRSPPSLSAVFSVLQFGAIVPPLAPWPGVHRALPGYRYEGNRRIGPIPDLSAPRRAVRHARSMGIAEQAEILEKVVDGVLRDALGNSRDPVVLFSGGVDSGFLASRLKAIGCHDTLLFNYAFRPDEPESALAVEMARRLGLKCEVIVASRTAQDPLESPGTIYPQPFADHSVVPTSELAYAVAGRLPSGAVVFDGTGADGGFGLSPRLRTFRRMLRTPGWLLRFCGRRYREGMWASTSRAEKVLRVLGRLSQMPPMPAIIAQNPLAGSWYSLEPAAEVLELLAQWIEPLAGDSLARQVVIADLALVCANVFAQKAKPILTRSNCKVCYPFMSRPVVSLAIDAIEEWPVTEAKAALKHSLGKTLPRALVYRPKSGFADPAGAMFFTERFLQHLRSAAEQSSPLAGFIHSGHVLKCCDLLRAGHHLPDQTLNTVWAITFLDRWYRTAVPASPGNRKDPVVR